MNKRKYNIEHAGWLLSSFAETNIAKGIKLFDSLPESDKPKAQAYCDLCVSEMAEGASEKMENALAERVEIIKRLRG